MTWLSPWGVVELHHPWLLLVGLLAIPAFIWARSGAGRLTFSSLGLLPRGRRTARVRLVWLPDALVAASIVLLAVALARPRVPDQSGRIERDAVAIMMVVDVSGSMRALDMSLPKRERTRLDAIQDVFTSFVAGGDGLKGRPDDAVGLVTFARYADTRCPVTFDHGNLLDIARSLEIVTDRSEDGTAIGDGLALAVERLRQTKAKSKVAILLTDGVSNAGDTMPLSAAKLAQSQNIKVHTVGVGTNGMAPVRVDDPFGRGQVLRQTSVEIDEEVLKEISKETGGQYFRATDAKGLVAVYAAIDSLERTKIDEQRTMDYLELYEGFVAAGLLLFCLGWLLRQTVWRRLP